MGDVKQSSLDTATAPHTYRPYSQFATPSRSLNIVVRALGDPAGLASEFKAAVWGLDRELAVAHVRTMNQVLQESTASRRFSLFLLSAFAAVALVMAGIGIYGVIAYSVVGRTHEIGIRVALGAHGGDVLRLVVMQALRLAILGVVIGGTAALFLTRLLASFLYEIRPTDPVTFAAGVVFLALIALSASFVPARRAAKVDPMVALRYE